MTDDVEVAFYKTPDFQSSASNVTLTQNKTWAMSSRNVFLKYM